MRGKTMAEVLGEHNMSSLIEGGWYCFNCDLTFGMFRDANAHQADALAAAGYGSIRQAQEVAWAKGAMAAGMNLFVLQNAGINPNPYRSTNA
jgi:hypothetical protein